MWHSCLLRNLLKVGQAALSPKPALLRPHLWWELQMKAKKHFAPCLRLARQALPSAASPAHKAGGTRATKRESEESLLVPLRLTLSTCVVTSFAKSRVHEHQRHF